MKIANFDELATSSSIEKDVYRTLPGNACFNSSNSTGVPRLRRILRGIAFFFNDIGYVKFHELVRTTSFILKAMFLILGIFRDWE